MDEEAAGAIVMLAAAVVALVWANSAWKADYFELWATPLLIELGDVVHLDLTLGEWVNDALMAIFFFVVALEIKRELIFGELSEPRKAALPAIAALGGMVVPALIYLAFNAGGEAVEGWGIPIATDIAFASGVLALVSRRVPSTAKIFLLTLAIVDDVVGIVIIAVFYADGLSISWLLAATAMLAVMFLLSRSDVRAPWVFVLCGGFVWFATHESGVHATIAGVVLGLLTPAWSFYDPERFSANARPLVDEIQSTFDDDTLTTGELEQNEADIAELVRLSRESTSPLATLLHALSPIVAFVIVPIFALANAGVTFTGEATEDLWGDRVLLGVLVGLVVGKTVGILGATWLAVRLRVGVLPAGARWSHVLGLAVTAGIGFTVALFITSLAFDDADLTYSAKIGVLLASLVAGVAGYTVLRFSGSRRGATPTA
jgi:NhaA family Na+:H+ antiporter